MSLFENLRKTSMEHVKEGFISIPKIDFDSRDRTISIQIVLHPDQENYLEVLQNLLIEYNQQKKERVA